MLNQNKEDKQKAAEKTQTKKDIAKEMTEKKYISTVQILKSIIWLIP